MAVFARVSRHIRRELTVNSAAVVLVGRVAEQFVHVRTHTHTQAWTLIAVESSFGKLMLRWKIFRLVRL